MDVSLHLIEASVHCKWTCVDIVRIDCGNFDAQNHSSAKHPYKINKVKLNFNAIDLITKMTYLMKGYFGTIEHALQVIKNVLEMIYSI